MMQQYHIHVPLPQEQQQPTQSHLNQMNTSGSFSSLSLSDSSPSTTSMPQPTANDFLQYPTYLNAGAALNGNLNATPIVSPTAGVPAPVNPQQPHEMLGYYYNKPIAQFDGLNAPQQPLTSSSMAPAPLLPLNYGNMMMGGQYNLTQSYPMMHQPPLQSSLTPAQQQQFQQQQQNFLRQQQIPPSYDELMAPSPTSLGQQPQYHHHQQQQHLFMQQQPQQQPQLGPSAIGYLPTLISTNSFSSLDSVPSPGLSPKNNSANGNMSKQKQICQNDGHCVLRKCHKAHPRGIGAHISLPCPNGTSCSNQHTDCAYKYHTRCAFDGHCNNSQCSFIHVQSIQKPKLCPKDGVCTFRGCGYQHPNGTGNYIELPCPFGTKCGYQTTSCPYTIHIPSNNNGTHNNNNNNHNNNTSNTSNTPATNHHQSKSMMPSTSTSPIHPQHINNNMNIIHHHGNVDESVLMKPAHHLHHNPHQQHMRFPSQDSNISAVSTSSSQPQQHQQPPSLMQPVPQPHQPHQIQHQQPPQQQLPPPQQPPQLPAQQQAFCQTTVCSRDGECSHRGCQLSHPRGRGFIPRVCHHGVNCKFQHSTCRFDHP